MLNYNKITQERNKSIPLNLILDEAVALLLIDIYGKVSYASSYFIENYHYEYNEIVGLAFDIRKKQLILGITDSFSVKRYKCFKKEVFFITKTKQKVFFIANFVEFKQDFNKEHHYCLTLTEVTRLIFKRNKLLFQVHHDPLTKLLNRYGFYESSKMKIKLAKHNALEYCIAIIDIDNFKKINDTFGHLCGDSLLKQFSKYAKESLPNDALFARLGGDEFVLMISGFMGQSFELFFLNFIDRLRLYSYHYLGKKTFNINVSIGIAQYPLDGNNLSLLLKNADIALYKAKKEGGNKVQKFI
ncbi:MULTISPECIES: GGDEF domain-containing protein [Providencia]|uniref:GGDEF domain-containing protein n=1 Tax=Providencia TaxID=586 RepID=UPI00111D2423|nr:GGDEF domain-containing protein [Providencia stuartii]ELR5040679.1 GGDEF domain-containing protein [Providencia stuartii]ELR5081679.1 GGDEF domain-containing protein [Providencia stuartii]